MSDEQANDIDVDGDSADANRARATDPKPNEIEDDTLLNLIVHLAEKGVGPAITLYTAGLVLTGIATSRKAYFEASEKFMQSTGLEVLFQEILRDFPDDEDGAPAPNYTYIHLRDAQVIAPGTGGMPNEGNLMRIKRSEVVGWSLGQLKAS